MFRMPPFITRELREVAQSLSMPKAHFETDLTSQKSADQSGPRMNRKEARVKTALAKANQALAGEFTVKIDPNQRLSTPFCWLTSAQEGATPCKDVLSVTPIFAKQICGADFSNNIGLVKAIASHRKIDIATTERGVLIRTEQETAEIPLLLKEAIDSALKRIPKRISENHRDVNSSVKRHLCQLIQGLIVEQSHDENPSRSYNPDSDTQEWQLGRNYFNRLMMPLEQSLGQELAGKILSTFQEVTANRHISLIYFYMDDFFPVNGYQMVTDAQRLEYVLQAAGAVPAKIQEQYHIRYYEGIDEEIYVRSLELSYSGGSAYEELAIFLPAETINTILQSTSLKSIKAISADIRRKLVDASARSPSARSIQDDN